MPQEHYVLRCFSCETFQAHIVKKAKKWECKMCGAKQSLKRNYGRGSAKDCRNQVMKLNELRLTESCNSTETEGSKFDDDFTVNELKPEPKQVNNVNELHLTDYCNSNEREDIFDVGFTMHQLKEERTQNKISKWAKYLEEPTTDSESEVGDCITGSKSEDTQKKRVKKVSEDCTKKSKKICMGSNVNDIPTPVSSQSFSSPSSFKTTGSCKPTKEASVNSLFQSEDLLKFQKYAKFLDSDVEDNIDNGNKNGKEKDINKLSNIFDSDLNDLDNILSLE